MYGRQNFNVENICLYEMSINFILKIFVIIKIYINLFFDLFIFDINT